MLAGYLDLWDLRLKSTNHFFVIKRNSREQSHALVCHLPVDPTELNNIDLMFLSSRSSVTIDRTLFHHHQSSREQKRALVCHQPINHIKLNNVYWMFWSSRSKVTINKILFHHHQCSREQSRALVCFQPVYPIVKNVLIFKILGYHQRSIFSFSLKFTGTMLYTCLSTTSRPYRVS